MNKIRKADLPTCVSGIVLDIDGCILDADSHVNFLEFVEFRTLCKALNAKKTEIVFCSGRPGAFLESLSILAGLSAPLLFEWGAGLIENSVDGKTNYHPSLDDQYWFCRQTVMDFIRTKLMKSMSCWIQPGKEAAITIFAHRQDTVDYIQDMLSNFLEISSIDKIFVAHKKSGYIDIRPKHVDKAVGFKWFLSRREHSLSEESEWLAIGDSIDDCSLLEYCGWSACPANADRHAKKSSNIIANSPYLTGVIEILRILEGGTQ